MGVQEFIQYRFFKNRFPNEVGIKLEYAEPKRCRTSLLIRKEHLNPNGAAHGGVLMTMADTTAGCAVAYLQEVSPTMDLHYRFLGPVYEGEEVSALATVIREGGNTVVVEVRFEVAGRIVGLATASFFRTHKEPPFMEEFRRTEGGRD